MKYGRRQEEGKESGGGVPTWTGLDTGGAVGELGVGVADHLVGLAIVQGERRTGVLARAVVIKVPAGLQGKHRPSGCILPLHLLATGATEASSKEVWLVGLNNQLIHS